MSRPHDIPAHQRTGSGDKYITPHEVAREIGHITPLTIKRWCKAGRFPGAFCPGTAGWRIPRSSWERFKKDMGAVEQSRARSGEGETK